MRSWVAIAPLLQRTHSYGSNILKCLGLAVGSGFCLSPLARFEHDPPRLGGIAPLADAHPLVGLQILIVGEEMLDLLEHDRGQVLPLSDVRIIRKRRIHGHADELFIPAMLVL